MNIDSINKLPRYIEAPSGGMWRIPEGFPVAAHENLFVRLDDVKKLFEKENNGNKS